jgi:hypothetical protein
MEIEVWPPESPNEEVMTESVRVGSFLQPETTEIIDNVAITISSLCRYDL